MAYYLFHWEPLPLTNAYLSSIQLCYERPSITNINQKAFIWNTINTMVGFLFLPLVLKDAVPYVYPLFYENKNKNYDFYKNKK